MRRGASGLLVCDGCAEVSDANARWRALRGTEDDDSEVVVVLCPDCAAAFNADATA